LHGGIPTPMPMVTPSTRACRSLISWLGYLTESLGLNTSPTNISTFGWVQVQPSKHLLWIPPYTIISPIITVWNPAILLSTSCFPGSRRYRQRYRQKHAPERPLRTICALPAVTCLYHHRLDATLTAKVNRLVNVSMNGTFLYDKNTSSRVQGTEGLALGISYTFP